MREILLGIDDSEERAKKQAQTVVDLFDTDDLLVHLLHDFTDNPEGASVVQVGSVHRAEEMF